MGGWGAHVLSGLPLSGTNQRSDPWTPFSEQLANLPSHHPGQGIYGLPLTCRAKRGHGPYTLTTSDIVGEQPSKSHYALAAKSLVARQTGKCDDVSRVVFGSRIPRINSCYFTRQLDLFL